MDARRADPVGDTLTVSTVGENASVTFPNAAGNQVVAWQLGYTDAAGVQHVASVEITNVLDGTACTVMGQVTSTG